MHFCRRIVDGDAARFFLLLFFRIVGSEVRRNAFPRLPMVARAKQELSPYINCSFLVRAHVNRRVPVEPQLVLVVVGERLDGPHFKRMPIDAANCAALVFRVNVIWV